MDRSLILHCPLPLPAIPDRELRRIVLTYKQIAYEPSHFWHPLNEGTKARVTAAKLAGMRKPEEKSLMFNPETNRCEIFRDGRWWVLTTEDSIRVVFRLRRLASGQPLL